MSDLFMRRSAVISDCGLYRRLLSRSWDDALPVLVVCMLNPSNADAERDDPTLLALIWFARLWGYGGLLIVNLYDWRSPSPAAMMAEPNRMTAENRTHIQAAIYAAVEQGAPILAAWGNDGDFEGEAEWFASRARHHGVDLICLGRTQSGAPKHPMARGKHRIPRDQQPIIWRAAA